MIASPSDVAAERQVVRQVLDEWNAVNAERRQVVLLPLGWETHSSPTMGAHPQTILNQQVLARGDLLIGVFWTRVGTPTERHVSGTVEEIEEHIATGKPVMLYFSNQPVRLDSVDAPQYEELTRFKDSIRRRGLYEEYGELTEFKEKLYRHLQLKLNDDEYFPEVAGADLGVDFLRESTSITLSDEARSLLKAATEEGGNIMRLAYMGGTAISGGRRSFVDANDRREVAKWEAAIDELERAEFIEDKNGKRELYWVTHAGFNAADAIPPLPPAK